MLFAEMEDTSQGVAAYRVLARKYRPKTFDELIGQDVLVRTLTNAIESGRLAQAYMLTGVRGIGKTTTARIIARALNCIGADGHSGPTIKPCGVCANCEAIAADRHVDVIEMDAASRTGVDDVREIVEGVRYGPVSARYKIYIIDEVHMLSKNAFNALLKTLEEPPPHTKFIFATTEIRKVPVTVLSRCQRFDLRRVDMETLSKHFKNVCDWEQAQAEDEAIRLIAHAADGSVRDGLSLLDQAIARADGKVTADDVRSMLGLADRARIIDLFAAIHAGKLPEALQGLDDLRAMGADALVVLHDLADITHIITRTKASPDLLQKNSLPEMERELARDVGTKLSVPTLARTWQMLLKGMQEVQHAFDAHKALEMVIIRLCHAADLPPPGDLIKKIQDSGALNASASSSSSSSPPSGGTSARFASHGNAALATPAPAAIPSLAIATRQAEPLATPQSAAAYKPEIVYAEMPDDFRALVKLFEMRREIVLATHLTRDVYVVNYQPGVLEFRIKEYTPANIVARVSGFLQDWTGKPWHVSLSSAQGVPSLAEQDEAAQKAKWDKAQSHPLVQAVLQSFSGAKLVDVRAKPVQTVDINLKDDMADDAIVEE